MLLKLAVLALIGLTLTEAQVPDARCPAVNTRPPTHLPHETDCRLFYLCHLGNKVLMPPCPVGKIFDAVAVPSGCMPSTQDPSTCVPSTVPPTTLPTTTPAPGTTEVGTTEAETTVPVTEPGATTEPATDSPTTIPNEPPTAPSKIHVKFHELLIFNKKKSQYSSSANRSNFTIRSCRSPYIKIISHNNIPRFIFNYLTVNSEIKKVSPAN